jgi:endonuclease YncB( thermonuclease family)
VSSLVVVLQSGIPDRRNPAPQESRMQILLTLLAAAVALSQTSPFTNHVRRSDPVVVRSVIDGDTIDVSTFGRVRLLGIDAPEIGRGFDTAAPFGREARARLTALVLHRWIRLEQEGAALDTYGRHLAYVMTEDGVCINATLVREGLARISARVPLSRLDELKRAEAEARRFRRGMWGGAPPTSATGYTPRSGATRSPAPRKKSPAAKRRTTSTKKTKTKTQT